MTAQTHISKLLITSQEAKSLPTPKAAGAWAWEGLGEVPTLVRKDYSEERDQRFGDLPKTTKQEQRERAGGRRGKHRQKDSEHPPEHKGFLQVQLEATTIRTPPPR